MEVPQCWKLFHWAPVLFLSLAPSLNGAEGAAAALDTLVRPAPGDQVGCRFSNERRDATVELASIGEAALPLIEPYLRQIENGDVPPGSNSPWLLIIYARIEGPRAVPRLNRIRETGYTNPAVPPAWVDMALANALGITALVDSRMSRPGRQPWCISPTPGQALSRFLVGWLRSGLGPDAEQHLTPESRTAWRAFLATARGRRIRKSLSQGPSRLGFVFETDEDWRLPEEVGNTRTLRRPS